MDQQTLQPPQHQDTRPGLEHEMTPRPRSSDPSQRGSGKLLDKLAIITGGDSGIGRATAIAFAREGADVAIVYLNEHGDAAETRRLVEQEGRECVPIAGDVGSEEFCRTTVEKIVQRFGRLDTLVNDAAEQ